MLKKIIRKIVGTFELSDEDVNNIINKSNEPGDLALRELEKTNERLQKLCDSYERTLEKSK